MRNSTIAAEAPPNTLRVICLATCAVLVFLCFGFVFPYQPQFGESLRILALTISALCLMMVDNLCDPRPRPVHLLFCIYMIVSYLLPGYFHTATGRFPFFSAGYSTGQVLNTAIVAAVFTACVFLGYSLEFPRRAIGAGREAVPARLRQAILYCAAASAVCAVLYGLGALRAPRGDDAFADTIASPVKLIFGAIAHSGSFYALMFAIILYRVQRSIAALALILLTLALFGAFNSPLAIPRSTIASYLISAFCVFLPFTRFQKTMLTVALIASQLTLFSYLSYLQRGDKEHGFTLDPFHEYVTSGDFDGFQSTINVVAMHDGLGGKGGVNLLSAIFFFVPRAVWPQKSFGTGGESASYMGYPFINISSPLPSEFYIDFGLPGVVALSFLFGLLMKACDDYFLRYKRTDDPIGQTFVSVVAGWIFVILRGSLTGTLGPIVLSLAIGGLCHIYATRPRTEDSSGDSP